MALIPILVESFNDPLIQLIVILVHLELVYLKELFLVGQFF